MAANPCVEIQKALNKKYKGIAPRITCSPVGSFVSIRIDGKDGGGTVTVKMFHDIMTEASKLLREAKFIDEKKPWPMGHGWTMDGCVATWEQRH